MNGESIELSFPVFEIESEIAYNAVRVPTVFERTILRLVRSGAAEIGKLTLVQAFEEQLGVQSVRNLLRPSVEGLISLGLLRAPAMRDLMEAAIGDLSLTTQGMDVLARNRLPSRPGTAVVRHLYYPLSSAIADPRKTQRLTAAPTAPVAIDAQTREPKDCSKLVEAALPRERHDWMSPDTEIANVSSNVVGTLWESHKLVLGCDSSRNLVLSAADSVDLQRWIDRTEAEVVWEQAVAQLAFPESARDLPEISEETLAAASAFRLICFADANASKGVNPAVLRIYCDPVGSVETLSTPALLLDPAAQDVEFIESKSKSPLVRIPFKLPLPPGVRVMVFIKGERAPRLGIAGIGTVYWAGQPHRAALQVLLDANNASGAWLDVRHAVEEFLQGSQQALLLAMPAAWEAASDTVERWRSAGVRSLEGLFSDARDFRAGLSQFSADADWLHAFRDSMVATSASLLAGLGRLLEHRELLHLLAELERLLPDDAELLGELFLTHAEQTREPDELIAIRQQMGADTPLPTSLIGRGVVTGWFARALAQQDVDLCGPHALVEPVDSLLASIGTALRDIGRANLEGARTGKLRSGLINAAALRVARDWPANVLTLESLVSSEVLDAVPGFRQFGSDLNTWSKLISERFAPEVSSAKRFIVFDTCALMDKPDLLSSLHTGDMPVVPHRVLEELDGLKEGAGSLITRGASSSDEPDSAEHTRAKARAAIRCVESAGQSVRFEPEALDLLPPEWGDSPDNRILSVAKRLALSRVLLVTSDRNLRNKAMAEGIDATGPDQYLRGMTSGSKVSRRDAT